MSNKNLVSLVSFILLLGRWIVLMLNEWQKNKEVQTVYYESFGLSYLSKASNIRELVNKPSIHTESF